MLASERFNAPNRGLKAGYYIMEFDRYGENIPKTLLFSLVFSPWLYVTVKRLNEFQTRTKTSAVAFLDLSVLLSNPPTLDFS